MIFHLLFWTLFVFVGFWCARIIINFVLFFFLLLHFRFCLATQPTRNRKPTIVWIKFIAFLFRTWFQINILFYFFPFRCVDWVCLFKLFLFYAIPNRPTKSFVGEHKHKMIDLFWNWSKKETPTKKKFNSYRSSRWGAQWREKNCAAFTLTRRRILIAMSSNFSTIHDIFGTPNQYYLHLTICSQINSNIVSANLYKCKRFSSPFLLAFRFSVLLSVFIVSRNNSLHFLCNSNESFARYSR